MEAIIGLSLISAWLFPPDPMNGFPPGTPGASGHMSGHGLLHFVSAGVAFLSLIAAACFVFARTFASLKQRGWVVSSVLTGAFFFVTWAALGATGSCIGWINLLFAVAVAFGWAWILALAVRLMKSGSQNPRSSAEGP
jgi:hypothetical protein